MIYIQLLVLFSSILKKSLSALDCVENDVWFEKCQYCQCIKSKSVCKPMPCMNHACIPGVIWYADDHRCHCTLKTKELVCVNLEFKKEIIGQSCEPGSYYYDTHTFCVCNSGNNKVECEALKGNMRTYGGICHEGEEKFEYCHKCVCTRSLFRKCYIIMECIQKKVKPGKCPVIEHLYSDNIRMFCPSIRKQECAADYECPGMKKCCRVVDCFFRCADPL